MYSFAFANPAQFVPYWPWNGLTSSCSVFFHNLREIGIRAV